MEDNTITSTFAVTKITKNKKRIEFILILSMFLSSIVFFRSPFEFYLYYIVFLFFLPFFLLKYGLPKPVFLTLFFTLLVGLFNIQMNNVETFAFVKIWGGALLTVSFYYYVFLYFNKRVDRIYYYYIKFCYFLLIVGIIQFISFKIGFTPGYDFHWLGLNKWGVIRGSILGIRINSLIAEPSGLSIVTIPAVYVALQNIVFKTRHYFKYLISNYLIILGLLITTSSTGYIGLMICLLFIAIKNKVYNLIFGLFFVSILFGVLYSNMPEFQGRVDASLALSSDEKITSENANTSSFMLYNNYIVALENIKEHPLFGTGLGSHPTAFKKYSLTVLRKELRLFDFNSQDANSLFLRLMSETGLTGLFFLFYILKKGISNLKHLDEQSYIISISLLILILLTLLRQGNYFLNGLPLIFIMYFYNKQPSVKND